MTENTEQRIYVAVAGTIHVPTDGKGNLPLKGRKTKTVIQPIGRQIAQACHVVSKLRHKIGIKGTSGTEINHNTNPPTVRHLQEFEPVTTIILQARDSAEMGHVYGLLHRRKLNPVIFSDDNPEYGLGSWPTAIAVLATKKQISGIMDYLPLWGSN